MQPKAIADEESDHAKDDCLRVPANEARNKPRRHSFIAPWQANFGIG